MSVTVNYERLEIIELERRVAELEADLSRLATFIQSRHPMGKVCHVGLRQAVPGAIDVIDLLERQVKAVKRNYTKRKGR